MNKNLEMYIASGNSLESLVTYDFKNESPWTDVNNEANPFEKFRLYKAKKEPPFDCDSSNGTCSLTSDLYDRLWGWIYENRFHLPKRLSGCFGKQWERMGSDTMNSFATIYRAAHTIYHGNTHLVEQNDLLAKFASLTHAIGNFTLVPFQLVPQKDSRSFNQYRGLRGNGDNPYFVYDFFDLSLKLVQENTSAQVFKDYIDTFFLNDYVDKDYHIVPLFERHQLLLKEQYLSVKNPSLFLPQTEAELNEYLGNVNYLIQKRGQRIVDELRKQVSNIATDNSFKLKPPHNKTPSKGRKYLLTCFSFVFLLLVLSCISAVDYYQRAGGIEAIIQEYGYPAFIQDFLSTWIYIVKNIFGLTFGITLFVCVLFVLLRFLARKFS